jgi:hypothetical protein
MELYRELAKMFLATEGTPLKLGNVEFWIDSVGPWAGVLSFSRPASQWEPQAMGQAVADLARCYPEVGRLVARYA